MADEPTTPPEGEQPPAAETKPPEDDQRVPYERFQKANQQAKEAKDKATKLEKDLADIRAQMEEREQQGLPELDQLKKRLEQAEKKAQEADSRADQAEQEAQNTKRERLVTSAAAAQNFIDPDDAVRYVNLGDIESAEDAERAVKRVAKAKAHLLKQEDPALPGRVLANGQRTTTGKKTGGIDLDEEAQMISDNLKKFLANRGT